MIKPAFTVLTLLSLPTAAAAQGRPCIPRSDAQAAMIFALPHAIEGARRACGPSLPPTAFLNSGAEAYSARLKADNPESWRSVPSLIGLFAGDDIPPGLTPETTATMASEILAGTLAKDIKPETCPLVDQLTSDIAAMPEQHLAGALLSIIQLTEKPSKKKTRSLTLCPVGPA